MDQVREMSKEERIARACHEANKALCEGMGDFSQPSWENAPDWQRDSALNGVRAHLAAGPSGLTPGLSHESWMAQKLEEGWTYGPVKDADKKEHPCMVPFTHLPFAQQAKDHLFGLIVMALR